jgi:hypothetical protein
MNHYIFDLEDLPGKGFIVHGYTTDHRDEKISEWDYQTTVNGNYQDCLNFTASGLSYYQDPEDFYNHILNFKKKIKNYIKPFSLYGVVNGNPNPRPSQLNPYKF